MFLLNGQNTNRIDILDRGLHYGDGLFETIAVIDECPLCLDKHLERLLSGCKKLKIDFNDIGLLQSEITSLCKNQDRAVLKITITSGAGSRGYKRDSARQVPTRLLAIYPWPEYLNNRLSEGIKVFLCSTRLGHNPELAGIKHLNRLEQVLARSEWNDADILEGLMLDIDNNVIAGTMSNVFAIFPDKKLCTPELSHCGVDGVVRQSILDHCGELGYESEIYQLSLEKVQSASEIFFCNSVAGILPVNQLGEIKYSSHLGTNKFKQLMVSQGVIAPS